MYYVTTATENTTIFKISDHLWRSFGTEIFEIQVSQHLGQHFLISYKDFP